MSPGELIDIKQIDERNIIKVVELLTNTFGRWPDRDLGCSPLDHYNWKYIENPYRMRNIVVAEIDGCVTVKK